ncbi:MAG: hypothetical protein V3U11_06730 [Planctomycetota bacterium]
MRYFTILLCAVAVGLQGQDQDPKSRPSKSSPTPPPSATSRPLPPVGEPTRTRVERRDLLQRFKGPSPLAGFYRLVAVHGPTGRAKGRNIGYLAVGRDHLSLHLQGPSKRRREPVFQSGFRRYRLGSGKIFMSNLVGHHVRDGKVLQEQVGRQEVRRYELLGTTLRIYQSARQYLEFVRIE